MFVNDFSTKQQNKNRKETKNDEKYTNDFIRKRGIHFIQRRKNAIVMAKQQQLKTTN